MPVYQLGEDLIFPPPEGANDDGIVAIGGDASPARLILGYSQGIFPWPSEGLPLLWFSPDPRFVLEPRKLHVARSLEKTIKKAPFRLRMDTRFRDVVEACRDIPRPGQSGTWITDELIDGYVALHELGYAHSVESYVGDRLVGGLYGVSLGGVFFGESMFANVPDASKVAFVALTRQLTRWNFSLIDCQVHTDNLERFGAEEWPRDEFLSRLRRALAAPTREGIWRFDADGETDGS